MIKLLHMLDELPESSPFELPECGKIEASEELINVCFIDMVVDLLFE